MLNCHFKNIFCIIFIRVREIEEDSPLSVLFRITEKRYNILNEHERKIPKESIILTLTTTIFESVIRKLELAVNNAIIFSLLTDIIIIINLFIILDGFAFPYIGS